MFGRGWRAGLAGGLPGLLGGFAGFLAFSRLVGLPGFLVPGLAGGLVLRLVYAPVDVLEPVLAVLVLFCGLALGGWWRLAGLAALAPCVGLGWACWAAAGAVSVACLRRWRGGWLAGFFGGWAFVVLGWLAWLFCGVFGFDAGWLAFLAAWGFAVVYSLGPFAPLFLVLFCLAGFLGAVLGGGLGGGGGGGLGGGLVGVVLGFALGLLLFSPPLNPSGRLVGVDPSVYYPRMVEEVRGDFWAGFWRHVDRPVFMVLLYLASGLAGAEPCLRFLTVFALGFYVLGVWVFAREFLGGDAAGFAALLAPVSFNVNVVLHAGYYNNLLASSLLLLGAAWLRRWLRGGGRWLWPGLLLFELGVWAHGHMALYFSLVLLVAGLRLLAARVFGSGGRADRRGAALWLFLGFAGFLQSYWRVWGFAAEAAGEAVYYGYWFTRDWWGNVVFTVFNCAPGAAVEPWGWLLAIGGALLTGGVFLNSWLLVGGGLSLLAGPEQWGLRQRALFGVPFAVYQAVAFARVYRRSRAAALALYLTLWAHTLGYVVGLLGG